MFRLCAIGALASGVFGVSVAPVEKVIALLNELKADVENEGKSEAKVYDEFACFCRDTTKAKSDAITAGRDNINSLSAAIEAKTASQREKEAELQERKANHETLTKNLADTEAQFAKETAEYEATAADLSKAIDSLRSAIKAMQDSKPASFLMMRKAVQGTLEVAEALDFGSEKSRRAAMVLLQVDPSDPEYKFHSQGIVDTLTQLLTEFTEEKRVLDEDWQKAKFAFEATIDSLKSQISENQAAMDQLASDIEVLKGEIAAARESLVNAEAGLKDDQLYMKDLTERCEVRANDWDQRSKLRADELEALTGALNVLTEQVAGLDTAVNERALLLQHGSQPVAAAGMAASPAVDRNIARHDTAPAFLQEASMQRRAVRGLRGAATLATAARQQRAALLIERESKRLDSAVLSVVASSLAADPFAKVKTLIQNLVERLLAEATAEATKKGFCDEQLGKANKDRDYRHTDTRNLDVEIQGLETKLIELEEEIELLTSEIAALQKTLAEATAQRETEHEENLETMKQAKEGVAAVTEALQILKVFYKQAAKAKVLLQASPLDEDTAGAGFEGAYKGKQERSHGVLGLLEVILSDFDRTYRTTEAAEQKAHEEFVEFDRQSRADIAGRETKKALNEEDAQTTKDTIAQKMQDLQTAQDLLDVALKTVEALKPTCIDTGMSYEERVAKREEEMAALKTALCILDTDGVEAECQ